MATGCKTLESVSWGSDEHFSVACLPCHRDDTALPAFGYCLDCHEHLCQTCYKHHKKATLSRHHNLLDKDAMPTTQQLTVSSSGTADNITTRCIRHKTELIKFYCHDHDMLLCSICVTLEHNKACHVDYIPDISDKVINGRDYKQTLDRVDALVRKCTLLETEISKCTNKSGDSLKDVLHEIKKYQHELNRRLDTLQKDVEARIQELQFKNNVKIDTFKSQCKDAKKNIKVTYYRLKQLNTPLQANHLLIELKQTQKQLQDYEQRISTLSTGDLIEEYTFIPNQEIVDVLRKEKMIGDILVKHNAITDTSQYNLPLSAEYHDTTPACLGEICVKTSTDLHRCCIQGMTMLPPDRLILSDRNSQSIKLVDVKSKSITSQLSMGSGDEDMPSDITSVTRTEVAVAIPNRQHIQFISVSGQLSKRHTVQTDGQCYGISCHQDKLIVTYCNPGKLEILEMTGTVATRVESTGRDIFDMPRYVHANSSTIYVADCGLKEVFMLNWNGQITGRMGGFKYPSGLASLGGECILVSDNNDNNVYQISSECSNSSIIVQDVSGPLALCVDDDGQKLYISRGTRNDPHINNSILVYNIQTLQHDTCI